ncbi:hypothetical protein PsorP6_010684 [Peronosclerospora sorghi]|uniref:Uncharacterized protein n=1 Tax=Peronosclerospora sorghi TaxID=230839 RepID=A0ACC0VUD2_9STRA|nr:hypothetical protein PsorP6_010684 [Peronosclerospora sorghi]
MKPASSANEPARPMDSFNRRKQKVATKPERYTSNGTMAIEVDSASAQLSGMTVNLLAYAPKRTRRLHKLACKFSSACSSLRALQIVSGCEQLNRIPRNSAFDMDSVKRINSCAASHTFSPLRSWPRPLSVNDTITSVDFCVSPLAPCCTPISAIFASSTDDNISASSGGSEPQTFGFGLFVSDDFSVHSRCLNLMIVAFHQFYGHEYGRKKPFDNNYARLTYRGILTFDADAGEFCLEFGDSGSGILIEMRLYVCDHRACHSF